MDKGRAGLLFMKTGHGKNVCPERLAKRVVLRVNKTKRRIRGGAKDGSIISDFLQSILQRECAGREELAGTLQWQCDESYASGGPNRFPSGCEEKQSYGTRVLEAENRGKDSGEELHLMPKEELRAGARICTLWGIPSCYWRRST